MKKKKYVDKVKLAKLKFIHFVQIRHESSTNHKETP